MPLSLQALNSLNTVKGREMGEKLGIILHKKWKKLFAQVTSDQVFDYFELHW